MSDAGADPLQGVDLSKSEIEHALLAQCPGAKAALSGVNRLSKGDEKDTGYLSAIIPLGLTWTGDNAHGLPTSVVVKAVNPANMRRAMRPAGDSADLPGVRVGQRKGNLLPAAHAAECRALRLLEHVDGLPVPKLHYSRPFAAGKSGLLVMENLTPAVHFPVGRGATNEQVESLLDAIASLHAHIYSLDGDDSWKEGFVFTMEFYEKLFARHPRKLLPQLEKLGDERMRRAIARIPSGSVAKCASAAAEWFANSADYVALPPVLCHGDLWSYNVMWRADGCGTASSALAAIIDWQLCHVGPPTVDIASLLGLSVSGEYRRANTGRLLRFYYERLAEKMGAKGKSPPFTLEELEKAYKDTLPVAVLFTHFRVPLFISSGMVTASDEVQFLLDVAYEIVHDVFGGERE